MTRMTSCYRRDIAVSVAIVLLSGGVQARAAACSFESQGEGRVSAVIDARTFRLEDGREVRLTGIESAATDMAKGAAALSAIIAGRDVTLRGVDDAPDRYGRQPAFVFPEGSDTTVQSELLSRGEALASAEVTDRDCAGLLAAAEAGARQAKKGTWADPTAIKNAESPGDILAGIGRFYSGRGQGSVRPAGRGNDLPEFRAELDTGLCCDYFKAHDTGLRSGRARP
jgi:endonuclease YncB( thermonuclease family)